MNAKRRMDAERKCVDKLQELSLPERFAHPFLIDFIVSFPQCHVVSDASGHEPGSLRNIRNEARRFFAQDPRVLPIDQNRSRIWLVEPQKQVNESGLSRSRGANLGFIAT